MKMIKYGNYTVETTGGIYGIANIESILGIVVLILTIFNILINSAYKIYLHYKKREIDEISKVVHSSTEEIIEAVEDFKELESDNNENK